MDTDTSSLHKKKLSFNNSVELTKLADNDNAGQALFMVKGRPGRVTITAVMKGILERASSPQTVEELVQWFAQENGFPAPLVYPAVFAFVKKMVRLGILTPEGTPPDTDEPFCQNLEEKKRFGEFVLLDKVKKNSKVVLYKCMRPKDEKIYLIKILYDKSEAETFSREYEILEQLPYHPYVRKCYASSIVNGTPYILMEYIEGTSLSKLVNESPLASKLIIGSRMIEALGHLHHHKVLHGDIHTSNFIVSPPNDAYLVDLGMAYYEHEQEIHHGGVPHYMPPERMPNHGVRFSKKLGNYVSEIFQLGTCLYYLLSGNYPFNGLLLRNLAQAIKHDSPLPLQTTPQGEKIPVGIALTVFKALEKKPRDRYQNAHDMLLDWNRAAKAHNKLELIPNSV